jgi:hypothetical protein
MTLLELEVVGPAAPQRVAERMLPLPAALPAFASAASARRRLREEALDFLLVVAPGTGRLLGAVDREALDARPCCQRRHGRCAVVQHLGADVHFCFPDEDAAEVLEAETELARRGKVPARRRIPLLVVDEGLRPLGIFRVESGDHDAGEVARTRAA